MLASLLERLRFDGLPDTPRRVFVARRGYLNVMAPCRICTDERQLINIAMRRHGFIAVAPESLA
jgi:hypothetical protein